MKLVLITEFFTNVRYFEKRTNTKGEGEKKICYEKS